MQNPEQNLLVFWLSYKTHNLADIFYVSIKMVTNFWLRSNTKKMDHHSNQSGIKTDWCLKILWFSLWGIVPNTFNSGVMTISFTLHWNEAEGAQEVVQEKGINCEKTGFLHWKWLFPKAKYRSSLWLQSTASKHNTKVF